MISHIDQGNSTKHFEQPPGVAEKNWLPVERGDYGIDAIKRIYAPNLERFVTWNAPKAEKLTGEDG